MKFIDYCLFSRPH